MSMPTAVSFAVRVHGGRLQVTVEISVMQLAYNITFNVGLATELATLAVGLL